MAKTFKHIDDALAQWIASQHMYFVATAPLSAEGHVNCSPKGGDTLRVLGPKEVAYLDGAGSGIETVAHLRENGRMVLMFCAFEGAPRIVRLHGRGTVVLPGDAGFEGLLSKFPPALTVRAIIHLTLTRVADSCGYGVPFMDYRAPRQDSASYVRKSSDKQLRKYLIKENQTSIDGLPGLTAQELGGLMVRRE